MRKKLFGTRRRKVAAVVLGAGALAGTAVAAFVIYTGASGTTSGSLETAASGGSAIVVSNNGTPKTIPIGGSVGDTVKFQNMDNSVAHTLSTLAGTFSSSPAECASHLSYAWVGGDPAGSLNLAAGASATWDITYSADSGVPQSCSAGSWTVTWSGTTNP